ENMDTLWIEPLPTDKGQNASYMKYWLNRIHDLYKDSQTRLVFFRLARGPAVRPDQPPHKDHSSVRDLAVYSNVKLIDEHFFAFLEKPELFQDELHLNGPGSDQFTITLAHKLPELLAAR